MTHVWDPANTYHLLSQFHCPQIQTNEHDDSPTERLVEHDPWITAAYVMFRVGVDAKGYLVLDWQEVFDASSTMCHNVVEGDPSILKPVSHGITFASVLLCDTAVCFLHAHEIGTHV